MELQNNNSNEHGRNEQIVSQFLLKSLHIVLDSRVPSIRPRGNLLLGSQQVKKSDKWFNLALGERPTALDSLNFWHRNLMEPMIIDIILVQEMPAAAAAATSTSASGYGALVETVIERWVVQYEYSRASHPHHPLGESSTYKKTYKKSIILLRSLYTMMRLLPAYRAYRKLCISSKACGFDINYKVSSFSAPFTRTEEESMKHYSFIPIEAQHGRLSISVKYRESLAEFNLETCASFPAEIITDYVGSPATDPFRAFPKHAATSFPAREMQSPTCQRPHSWTSGITRGRGSPPTHRYYDLSSSPTTTTTAATTDYNRPPTTGHHRDRDRDRDRDRERDRDRYRDRDDYQLSPPFSPSPPTYLPAGGGGSYMQSRLRSETAPVSIPTPMNMITTTPRYLSPNLSDPNRHLPPPSPRSTRYELSSHESPSGIRSLKKSANHYSISSPKVSRDNKDDSGRFSGLLSSSGSPRVGFSRSSSRLSLQDELDDMDFSCPFIVDDVDTCDDRSPSVSESVVGGKELPKKSQDAAAVGALVRMLRTAPPLRQDSSCYSLEFNTTTNNGLFMARKTSDALEDLKAYTDIKNLILSKSFLTKEGL